MFISNIRDYKNGWICGDFLPSIFRTKGFEVGIHTYQPGFGIKHTHKKVTEINYIISGKILLYRNWGHPIKVETGSIFGFLPEEVSDVEFLEETQLVIIKFPSIPKDKILL